MFKIDFFEWLFLQEAKFGKKIAGVNICDYDKTEYENGGDKISFQDLKILASVCIPSVPIARAMFFEKLSETYYNQLSKSQKKKMFNFITKQDKFNKEQEDCKLFYDRFNPANQYVIKTNFKGKIDELQ